MQIASAWEQSENFDLYDDVVPVLSELRRRMQGKSCFNFTSIEAEHLKELEAVTKKGIAGFKNLKLPWT